MIRHIVLFKFLEEADGRGREENLRLTAEKLRALQGVVPTLLRSEIHIGAEGAAASNADLVLISDFADLESLNEYIHHPAHVAVGTFMRPLRESRTCIDYCID